MLLKNNKGKITMIVLKFNITHIITERNKALLL